MVGNVSHPRVAKTNVTTPAAWAADVRAWAARGAEGDPGAWHMAALTSEFDGLHNKYI